ncbi:unnamed protein product [Peronospora farinosa]|uniref:Methyltransferase domain-containing protein n=1 Tax=Peronospora farinosa TaxID=134698 RepID=A0AAV0TF08_9STRA|nr:unnamed protein product [Peronospora farinosa]CAI5718563.1 unnamed protein product [Peronospora farinosa]
MSAKDSWLKNLTRQKGGFWDDLYWYDLQLERRLPQAHMMLQQLVLSLPPCGDKQVLDLCAGSGRVSAAVLAAYPTAQFTLIDASKQRLTMARQRLEPQKITTHVMTLTPNDSIQFCSQESMDLVVACLAFHVLVEQPSHYAQTRDEEELDVKNTYELLFRATWRALRPGGHVVFGDHVGQLGMFQQLEALKRAGFEDVDCSWRVDDSFVAGGRKPLA